MIAHAEDAPARILIGGRAYRPIKLEDVTLEHDLFLKSRMARAGFGDTPLEPAETADEYATRLLGVLIASPIVLELVAGLAVPEDLEPESWTEEMAKDTARSFARLTEPADKAAVYGLIASALVPFLQSGLVSLSRMAPSSEAAPAERNRGSESATSSDRGTPWSAP